MLVIPHIIYFLNFMALVARRESATAAFRLKGHILLRIEEHPFSFTFVQYMKMFSDFKHVF